MLYFLEHKKLKFTMGMTKKSLKKENLSAFFVNLFQSIIHPAVLRVENLDILKFIDICVAVAYLPTRH